MRKPFITIILLCSLAASCSVNSQSPETPPIDFDSAYLNQQIKLTVVNELSAFRTDSVVALLLEYNTTNEIVFPSNYNLRLFIQQDGEWVEVKEKPTIRPDEPVVLSPNIPTSYGHIVAFWPQLDNLERKYDMRAYLFGDMKTAEGIQKVATFADFILRP